MKSQSGEGRGEVKGGEEEGRSEGRGVGRVSSLLEEEEGGRGCGGDGGEGGASMRRGKIHEESSITLETQ